MILASSFSSRKTYSHVELTPKIWRTWITIGLTWLSCNAFGFNVAIRSTAWWTMTIFLETIFQWNTKPSLANTILSFVAFWIFRTFWDNAFVKSAYFSLFAIQMLKAFVDAIMSNFCITVLILEAIIIAGTTRRSAFTTILLTLWLLPY